MKLFTKNTLLYDYILLGLYLYYIGNMLHDYIYFNAKWTRLVSSVGLLFLFWGGVNLGKSLIGCDKIIKPVFAFLSILCLIHVVIGIPFCNEPMSILLFFPQYLWLFIIPFTLLLPANLQYVLHLFNWSLLYVLTSLVFSLYNFSDFFFDAEYLMNSIVGWDAYVINRPQEPALLLYPLTAFVFFAKHLSKMWKMTIVIASSMAIVAGMMAGRRSVTAIFIGLIFIQYLVLFFQSRKRVISACFFIVLLGFFLQSYLESSKAEIVFEQVFPVLSERIDSDSRSGTEEDFFKDMDNFSDWLFGRGLNGTYKSPSVSSLDRLHRIVIETGYLNIILHGGLLMLIPYLVLLLYASYMGFCCSNSFFLKCCAGYVFMHIAMLYPEGTPKLTLDYFILFVFIRLCISKEWRLISDSDVKLKIHQFS